jgi:hypothetical protein
VVLAFVILDSLHSGQIVHRHGIFIVLFLAGWFFWSLLYFPEEGRRRVPTQLLWNRREESGFLVRRRFGFRSTKLLASAPTPAGSANCTLLI